MFHQKESQKTSFGSGNIPPPRSSSSFASELNMESYGAQEAAVSPSLSMMYNAINSQHQQQQPHAPWTHRSGMMMPLNLAYHHHSPTLPPYFATPPSSHQLGNNIPSVSNFPLSAYTSQMPMAPAAHMPTFPNYPPFAIQSPVFDINPQSISNSSLDPNTEVFRSRKLHSPQDMSKFLLTTFFMDYLNVF